MNNTAACVQPASQPCIEKATLRSRTFVILTTCTVAYYDYRQYIKSCLKISKEKLSITGKKPVTSSIITHNISTRDDELGNEERRVPENYT